MPLQPGEVSLLTLFADIHYYFGPPTSKPVHHRFDKSSYVYLYHDAINKRGRLEIANHAGTADQDAFQGFLDLSLVEFSSKQPNLYTITVESPTQGSNAANRPQDSSQWHLPAHDLRNEGKYMYKIHTIDLYFWTTDDATLFSDSLRRCLQPQQVKSLDPSAVHSEHRDSMSPVVQQLEKAAISSPGQVQRNDSVSTAQSSLAPQTSHTPVSPLVASHSPPAVGAVEAPGNFAPMAYNPASPGVPEPIAHREKTPPPADAATGTGLAQAAMHEHGTAAYGAQPGALPHQGSFQSQQSYGSGTPQHAQSFPPPPPQMQHTNSFPPPPPQQHTASPGSQQGQQYAQSFAPPPQQTPHDPNAHLYGQQPQQAGLQRQSTLPNQYQPQATSPPAHQQSFSPQPTQQYANYRPGVIQQGSYQIGQPSPGFNQAAQSPGLPPPPPQPQQQTPIGGYSTYNYTQTGAGAQPPQEAYSIHQQVYRPTEGEAAHAHSSQNLQAGQPAQAGPGQQAGKFEQRMDKYEKGVSKFFKRLDKKF